MNSQSLMKEINMKIGIASDDQHQIAGHFGRCKGFVIADVQNNQITSKEYRLNTFSHHSKEGEHQHDHGPIHGHSHDGILKALADCQVVIARGMGRRIYDDLRGAQIDSVITSEVLVENALEAYLKGLLEDHPEQGCQH
jgi:predicted Fe-Mo cluster-binding NifX family protein